jgi:hypothetical protein
LSDDRADLPDGLALLKFAAERIIPPLPASDEF